MRRYDLQRMSGAGYAYISNWVSQAVYSNPDGSLNASAYLGALGVIGATNLDPTNGIASANETTTRRKYIERWKASGAGADGCASWGPPWCDLDSRPSTFAGYGASAVDSVLLYAHGLDALLKAGGSADDSDSLHAAILSLPPIEGISGPLILDKSTGDAMADIPLFNLQLGPGGLGQPKQQSGLRPQYVPVGRFLYESRALVRTDDAELRFSGLYTTTPQSTRRIEAADALRTYSRNEILAVVGACFACLGLLAASLLGFHRRVRWRKERDQERLEEEAVATAESSGRVLRANELHASELRASELQQQEEKRLRDRADESGECAFWFVDANWLRRYAWEHYGHNLAGEVVSSAVRADAADDDDGRGPKEEKEEGEQPRQRQEASEEPNVLSSAPSVATASMMQRKSDKHLASLLHGAGAPRRKASRLGRHGPGEASQSNASSGHSFHRRAPAAPAHASASEGGSSTTTTERLSLPSFQELRDTPSSPLERLQLNKQACLSHLYQRRILAVSHTWQDFDEPDREGGQLLVVLAHVLANPDIRYVWFE